MVYLYCPRVALQRPLDVVHLLERVAHVGVGVGERRLDPGKKQIKNTLHTHCGKQGCVHVNRKKRDTRK